ncbi:hypothetical protein T484DRAFT_1845819 [Baffinella frigidus]|nr:hypothetical protein T484DRAFT_1845819 [Cryptophyta sp. CCMP2293]
MQVRGFLQGPSDDEAAIANGLYAGGGAGDPLAWVRELPQIQYYTPEDLTRDLCLILLREGGEEKEEEKRVRAGMKVLDVVQELWETYGEDDPLLLEEESKAKTEKRSSRRKGKEEEEEGGRGLFFMYVAVDDFEERTFRLFERFGEIAGDGCGVGKAKGTVNAREWFGTKELQEPGTVAADRVCFIPKLPKAPSDAKPRRMQW